MWHVADPLRNIDFRLFASTFGLISLAELPDKTMLATICLATQYEALPIFAGVALAFVAQNLIAVSLGQLISLLPSFWVKHTVGLIFLIFAVVLWFRRRTGDEPIPAVARESKRAQSALRTVALSFGVLFVSEWGDLTQLSTAALAASYHQPVTIFVAATLAHWVVAGLAILVGSKLSELCNPLKLQRASAILFAMVGTFMMTRG